MLNKKLNDPALKAQVAKLKEKAEEKQETKKPKKGTIAYIQLELSNLKKDFNYLKNNNTKLIRKIIRTANLAKNSAKTVEEFNTLLHTKALHTAKNNVHEITLKYRAANIKTLVMGEVVGAYAQRKGIKHKDVYKLMLLIIKEYDQVDSWWINKESLTLIQWIKHFLNTDKGAVYED